MKRETPDTHSAVERFTRAVRSVTTHPAGEVFADFVQVAAYKFANTVHSCTGRRERIVVIRDRYTESERLFFLEMRSAFEDGVSLERDFLGDAFNELDLQPQLRCQHPYSALAVRVYSEMTLSTVDLEEKIRTYGWFRTRGEDARSGGVTLAIARMMMERGYDPRLYLYTTQQAAHPILAYMCYLQLAALEIPAVVSVVPWGAKDPVERLYTPAHYDMLPDILRGLRDRELAEQQSEKLLEAQGNGA